MTYTQDQVDAAYAAALRAVWRKWSKTWRDDDVAFEAQYGFPPTRAKAMSASDSFVEIMNNAGLANKDLTGNDEHFVFTAVALLRDCKDLLVSGEVEKVKEYLNLSLENSASENANIESRLAKVGIETFNRHIQPPLELIQSKGQGIG